MPLWVRLVARFGLARTWLAGMLLAIVAFVWAALLGAGDVVAYTAVCVASGIALGADLALPGALLAGVIQRAGHGGRLRAPTSAGGTSPPSSTWRWPPAWRCRCWRLSATRPAAATPRLQALTIAYCLLPCALKLAAAACCGRLWIAMDPNAMNARNPEGTPMKRRLEPWLHRWRATPPCWPAAPAPTRPTTRPRSRCWT
jgi:glycoside/pentoside/hexuronide:cation symporter, GPH family